MTVQEATRQLLFQLFHVYEQREAGNIADLVMERITEWRKIDRILNKAVPLSFEQEEMLTRFTAELLNHRPVQYVLHEAWFYGMNLYVDENVLIPRPETEELVTWVLNEFAPVMVHEEVISGLNNQGGPLSILDVGSGSGCVALALKKKLPGSRVTSCDVSEKALEVAKRNALANQTDINFTRCNFLDVNEWAALPCFDCIVSNPPYVPLRDKAAMSSHIIHFEPHLALFVEDDDPLVFYRKIADFSKTHMAANGQVFVEIHEDLGDHVKEVFAASGFIEIQLRKDMQGKNRLLKAVAGF